MIVRPALPATQIQAPRPLPASTPAPTVSGQPDPYVLLGFRSELLDAVRWSGELRTAMTAPLPAGPMTTGMRERFTTGFTSASFGASAGNGASSLLDVLRTDLDVPTSLDDAVRGVLYTSDALRRDEGYLHGLVDTATVPDTASTYMLDQVRIDAQTMFDRASAALVELHDTGWIPDPQAR